MLWPKNLNKKIKTKISLASHTSFKIGGEARFFFEPKNLKELKYALIAAKCLKIQVFILGSGTNILINDSGINGLVIKLTNKSFKKFNNKGGYVVAGSGLKLSRLLLLAKDKGLSGFEFLVGLPGTVGGALSGNAGAWGRCIGDLVKEILVLDYNGNLELLKKDKLKFSYRKSNLNKCIIIQAKFKLFKNNKKLIMEKIKEFLLKRKKTQNSNFPSAGCIFKNPPDNFAGKLIDLCGLKGKKKGGASICKLHANFILNINKAKYSDVLYLINLISKKVKKSFQINLEPEIKIWK